MAESRGVLRFDNVTVDLDRMRVSRPDHEPGLLHNGRSALAMVELALEIATALAPPIALAAVERLLDRGPYARAVDILERSLPHADDEIGPHLLVSAALLNRNADHRDEALRLTGKAIEATPPGSKIRAQACQVAALLATDVFDSAAAVRHYDAAATASAEGLAQNNLGVQLPLASPRTTRPTSPYARYSVRFCQAALGAPEPSDLPK